MRRTLRSDWYRIAKRIPLTELHALHIIDALKRD
jgi:hypothetical protein